MCFYKVTFYLFRDALPSFTKGVFFSGRNNFRGFYRDMRQQKHITFEYEASLLRILILRMREGYFVRRTYFEKAPTHGIRAVLCIELCLPWRSMAFINYCIKIPWPFDRQRYTFIAILIIPYVI